jgi:DIL domain
MNLSVLEEWIEAANLPRGILSHLAPVRDLLNWLQVRNSDLILAIPNAMPGTVLVLYRRVFKPGGNNPNFEALEPSAGRSLAGRIAEC